ncbi:MAG TPA: cytochrome c biogenesis protein CcdA [Burkholderiales bacterium]
MASVLLGLLAGTLTVLSPCVLPVLPFVLFAALERHRFAPLALAAGLVVAFTGAGLAIAGASIVWAPSADVMRQASAVLLVVFGAILLLSTLKNRVAALGASLTGPLNRALERLSPDGWPGHFTLGLLLGAVWTPCTGPTLGAAITWAASSATLGKASLVMLAFGAGASLPLLAIAYGSRQALQARRAALARIERLTRPALGGLILALGAFIALGVDKAVEAALVRAMPDWLVYITTLL